MIKKTIAAITASTMLMGSSQHRPVPIYVHCNAPSEVMAQKACKQLIKNLRARKLRRSVAPLNKTTDRAGVGLHITFHMQAADDSKTTGFLSWGNAGSQPLSQQKTTQKLTVDTQKMGNNFDPMIDQLVTMSGIQL
jgi:hypothetical protein